MRATALLMGCAVLSLLSGCGSDSNEAGGSGGSGGADGAGGSDGKLQVPVTSLTSMRVELSDRTDAAAANVVFSNLDDTCEALVIGKKRNTEHASYTATYLEFGVNGAGDIETGNYGITHRFGRTPPQSGRFATAATTVNDAQCNQARSVAASGSITVDSVDGSSLKGSFSIQFENGQLMTGDFDAPDCPEFATTTPDEDAPAEMQCEG